MQPTYVESRVAQDPAAGPVTGCIAPSEQTTRALTEASRAIRASRALMASRDRTHREEVLTRKSQWRVPAIQLVNEPISATTAPGDLFGPSPKRVRRAHVRCQELPACLVRRHEGARTSSRACRRRSACSCWNTSGGRILSTFPAGPVALISMPRSRIAWVALLAFLAAGPRASSTSSTPSRGPSPRTSPIRGWRSAL